MIRRSRHVTGNLETARGSSRSWAFWVRDRSARPRLRSRSATAITRNRIISTLRTRRRSPESRKTPTSALKDLKGLVIIDEVQRAPDLFPLLRVLSDRRPRPARFLVLGSAAPDLLRQTSESLGWKDQLLRTEWPGVGRNRTGAVGPALAAWWFSASLSRSLAPELL